MFGFLKSKVADLQAASARYADKETAEAIVAVMTGVAYADGEMEPAEKAKIGQAFSRQPLLAQFDVSVLTRKFHELAAQFDFDTDIGLDACIKELKDVGKAGDHDKAITIMRLGIAAAKADGEVEPEELAFLTRCASTLGVDPGDVGLHA